jgi:hypothetical protein
MMPIHYGAMLFGSGADPKSSLELLHAEAAKEGISDRIISLETGEQRILF